MGRNSIFNLGKEFLKDTASKMIIQGKEIIATSVEEATEMGKEKIIEKASEEYPTLGKLLFADKNGVESESAYSEGNGEEKNEKLGDQLATTSPSEEELKGDIVVSYDNYGDDFEKKLHANLGGLAKGLAVGNPAEAAAVLKNLITMAGEVSKFTETQKTERKKIEAERDEQLHKIAAQKEIMLSYLDKTFDERRENFAKFFNVVDIAIANNNMEMLSQSLQGITTLAAMSPFKSLADINSTQKALNDQNHVWDF